MVWFAISVHFLVELVMKELGIELSLDEMMHILSLPLFDKTPNFQAFSDPKSQNPEPPRSNRLNLFDL